MFANDASTLVNRRVSNLARCFIDKRAGANLAIHLRYFIAAAAADAMRKIPTEFRRTAGMSGSCYGI